MRLFFATDVHGSETCWRKFLNAGEHYKADVIVLGGDMTGKALVPVIHDGGDRWHATLLENRCELTTEDEVAAFEEAVIRRGYYPFRTDPDELRELAQDEPRWHALFEEHMLETVERWMELADERLAGTGIALLLLPRQRRPVRGRRGHRSGRSTSSSAEGRVVDIGRLPDGVDRLGEPHAVGHLPRGGRAGAEGADRQGDRAGHGAAREAPSSASTARRTAQGSTTRPS